MDDCYSDKPTYFEKISGGGTKPRNLGVYATKAELDAAWPESSLGASMFGSTSVIGGVPSVYRGPGVGWAAQSDVYASDYAPSRGYRDDLPDGQYVVTTFGEGQSYWTYQYGSASDYTMISDFVRYGSKSIKTTVPSSGNRAFSKEFGYSVDLSSYNSIRVSLYISGAANISSVKVMVYGGTNFAELTIRNIVDGWNNFSVNKEAFYVNAGMDFASVTKVRFNATANANGSFDLIWDACLLYKGPSKQYVAFAFDDGFLSALYTVAPLMAKYKAVGSSFVPGAFIGTSGKMTASEILMLKAYGWDIGAHGYSHVTAYDSLSVAEIKEDIALADSAFSASGIPLPDLLAYPIQYTISDIEKERVIYARYRAARAGGGTVNRSNSDLIGYPARSAAVIPAYSMTVGASAIIAKIDAATPYKAPLILYVHDVATVAPSQGISTADLDSILSHCASNNIEIVSMSQLLDAVPGFCGGLY